MTRSGRATPEGTAGFAAACAAKLPASHFNVLDALTVSSIGLGTYLGEEDHDTDQGYAGAAAAAAQRGCNLFDTAINYRAQRSERALGHVLGNLVRVRHLTRDQFVVCTKGGYIPFESHAEPSLAAFVQKHYVEPGLLRADDVVAGCHALAPRFLADQVGRSLANLGLDCIDVYYLHNPETQLAELPRPAFLARMRAAFEALEGEVARGRIGRYGVATWAGLRRPPDAPDHLSLAELVGEAVTVAGTRHHLRVVQLPYNLAMTEAFSHPTQRLDGEPLTAVAAAHRLGVRVVASASLLQGQLTVRLPHRLADALPDLETPAQRALQFVRSTPGVTAALVGMSRRSHVEENLKVARVPPHPAGVDALFAHG